VVWVEWSALPPGHLVIYNVKVSAACATASRAYRPNPRLAAGRIPRHGL